MDFGISFMLAAAKTTSTVSNTANVVIKKTGLASWIVQGGLMMIPIIVASVVALAIIIERMLYLRRARIDTNKFMDKIKRVLGANRVMEALVICENTPGPIANLVRAGIGGREWKLDENIDSLVKKGKLKGVIVVGIYNNAKRIAEYTPSRTRSGSAKGKGGELSAYAKYIVQEVKPFIDKRYRTLKGRKYTGIMGSSLGGLASFYILAWYPKIFSRAAVISPSFWWDDKKVLKDVSSFRFPRDVKIYIDGGWKEDSKGPTMIRHMRKVYTALRKAGLKDIQNIMYYEDPRGRHNEASWARRGKWPVLHLFGRSSSIIRKIRLVRIPAKIGVGDRGDLFAQVYFSCGMRMTKFGKGFTVKNKNLLEIDAGGKITGLRPGLVFVTYRYRKKLLTTTIKVLKKSISHIDIYMNIYTSHPVKQLYVIFKKPGKNGPGKKIALKMITRYHGVYRYSGKKLGFVRMLFVDEKGRKSHTRNGRLLAPIASFSRNRRISIKVHMRN